MSFAKSSELNDNSIRPIRNATLYCTKRNCLVLDFMRHLRHSFCHALLKKEGKAYLLVDNYRGRVSCRGYLPSKLVVDFLTQLNQECEEKITCKIRNNEKIFVKFLPSLSKLLYVCNRSKWS